MQTEQMQIEQQHAPMTPVPEYFRHLIQVFDSWRTAMKDYLSRDISPERTLERTAGYRSYFIVDASNPYQPGTLSHQEWEQGYDEADARYTW